MNPNSDGVRLTKFTTKLVVGIGAGRIASDIIKNNSRVPVTKIDKIVIPVAAFVIGMMVSEAVESYANKTIDSMIESVNNFRNPKSEDPTAS